MLSSIIVPALLPPVYTCRRTETSQEKSIAKIEDVGLNKDFKKYRNKK